MSKKVAKVYEPQFPTGGARPGPVLASAGINMPQFCTAFNGAMKGHTGDVVPVTITACKDKSFDLIIRTTPATIMVKKAAEIKKASGSQKEIFRETTVDQLRGAAEYKIPDLNANDVKAATRTIIDTAKNMGVEVEGFK